MTQQEEQLLNGLIERVNGTQLSTKDADAERLLGNALGKNPDALYVLCQTVLVQQFAMENAQRQLTDARAEIEQLKSSAKPQEHGSFLGNLFGLGKSDSGQPAPQQGSTAPLQQGSPAPVQQGPGYAPVNNPVPAQYGYPGQPVQPPPGYGYGQQGYGQPGYGGAVPMGGGGMFGGGGGFLQGAMQTAAGVVAGEFAFRAIEDVFHGFGGGGGRGFEGGNTEVVNNYYGSDSGDSSGFGDRLRDADGLGNNISSDIEDRRGESHGFFGSADDSSGAQDDFAGNDDSSGFDSSDDSGYDDGSSGGSDDSF